MVVAVVLALASWQGGFFIGAKSTTAGAVISQGETYEVVYTTSAQVPSVKIEICRGTKCQALANKATGTKTTVKVPKNYTLGAAFFKVMERNASGSLTGKIQRTIPIVVIAAANVPIVPDDSDTKNSPSPTASTSTPASISFIGGGVGLVAPTPQPTPAPSLSFKPQIGSYCMYFPGYHNYVGSMYATVEWFGSDTFMGIRYRLKGHEGWSLADRVTKNGDRFVSSLYFSPNLTGGYLDYNQQFEVQIFSLFDKMQIAGVPSQIYSLSSGSRLPLHMNNHMWCLPVGITPP